MNDLDTGDDVGHAGGSGPVRSPRLRFCPEPGACGGRLDPGQTLVPEWLADAIDWHVLPSISPWAISVSARTACEHINWEDVWLRDSTLFTRHRKLGAPMLEAVWNARRGLAELGYGLCVEVELEPVGDELALVVCGAGVLGRLNDEGWALASSMLTTCATILREPRPEGHQLRLVRPARPSTSVGKRPLAQPVSIPPSQWEIGDWCHTWWSYLDGPLAEKCSCTAHRFGELAL